MGTFEPNQTEIKAVKCAEIRIISVFLIISTG